jgi:hypothetical protein
MKNIFSLIVGATSSLFSPQVVWAEQQFVKQRVKRDFIPPPDDSEVPTPASRSKRADLEVPSQRIRLFNDELWDQEWYLVSNLCALSGLYYTMQLVLTF